MRRPIFFIIVIIFVLGILTNESTSLDPTFPLDFFNLSPISAVVNKARQLSALIYPDLQGYLTGRVGTVGFLLVRWLSILPEALIEAFYMAPRVQGVLAAFRRIVPEDALTDIYEAIARVPLNNYEPGGLSLAINRPLGNLNGLNNLLLQLRTEQLVTECLFRIGYELVGRPRFPEFNITVEEAWIFIMIWLMNRQMN